MKWDWLHRSFINAMVQDMYGYEAKQVLNPNLLSNAELDEFYCMYCCM
jgi:hypothetical protein